ncbi:hypothetical protein AB0D49_41045 [Streptomyces sp. NPDC048290]|uniref:hypothetical protein n=1 Tax=Streptomyces sp. NPDC048290 TaxID=3155811 RepID=UPI00341BD4F7
MTDDEIIYRLREQDAAGELPPPASPEAVAELEAVVGHPMPPLLRRIYLEVADGGFGRWGGGGFVPHGYDLQLQRQRSVAGGVLGLAGTPQLPAVGCTAVDVGLCDLVPR